MTGEYTFVTAERQNELTRRIQQKLRDAAGKNGKVRIVESPVPISGAPVVEEVLSTGINRTINNTPAPSSSQEATAP
jgi:hypothetical protein